ncbi:flagellar hook assembly protein FlgD [Maridesulfovibrio hydrothermalis]|uniref:Basal-body rod modification protein FlgD n=1 Tax=Maridesulfovibrio hydrothermalis AM13 = DSM 14728 TaxID=1121451 RepID=L0RCB6_9BACT|nr:flagellar hook assembly protein FlgD [Maridesulfovibrio hydrothermalis]CCO23845.1 Flagellar hook capping protein [Maridesulfovibrio hydrothermalis AM13 = DSM 14728]
MGYVGYSNILGRAEADMAASNKPKHKSTMGQDDFMKLLLTQMQNQDPVNPMEDKEYMAQMAQFSSLEQLTQLNTSMKTMIGNNAQDQMVSAVGFIGKEVRAEGYSVSREGNEISKIFYGLGEPVANAFINIYDKDNNLVRTEQLGSKAKGTYEFEWDGKNWAGKDAPDGVYTIGMAAEDADGKPVMVKTEVSGEVTGVVSEGGQQFLHLKDGRYINFLNIREVVSPTDVSDKDETPAA